MARATHLERAHAAASAAGLGNGRVHSQRHLVHVNRAPMTGGYPRPHAGFGLSNSEANDLGAFSDRPGPFCLDVRCELSAAPV